ncbi:hypothetical protein MHN80_07905 [Gordonia McavH-238-E]|uniref:hypothetical protein n=1 Tax=Gordonia sp. McavH-238-E TaxID=2917736 RepID=UPI001EF50A33|nr:hypothetical protein [Gordonia sp. McavH-238-E]MCG7632235.1 hypothetical protein [Gordonia sp. McavH-238-E]
MPSITMTELEFTQSRLGVASITWITFFERGYDYLRTTQAAVQALVPVASLLGSIPEPIASLFKINLDADKKAVIVEAGAKAQREMDAEFHFTNALVLLSLWGGFEAYIEDVCKAAIAHDRSLLDMPCFNKTRYPISTFLQLDDEHMLDRVLKDAVSAQRSNSRGVGKFESQLELVGLNGHVPRIIKSAILHAQQDRNVWAHRAGVADKRYFDDSGGGRFTPGQTVTITRDEVETYLLALMIYGLIVINRFREKHGLPPAPVKHQSTHPVMDAYSEMYPDASTADSNQHVPPADPG